MVGMSFHENNSKIYWPIGPNKQKTSVDSFCGGAQCAQEGKSRPKLYNAQNMTFRTNKRTLNE